MKFADSLGSIGVALALIGLVVGDVRLWTPGSKELLSQLTLILAGITCLIPSLIRFKFPTLNRQHFLAVFGVLFFSDWFSRGFTLFQGPGFRGEIIAATMLVLFLFRHQVKLNFSVLHIVATLFVATEFMLASGGIPLLMDDNGVFFFRLELLKRFFPNIPFYYTLWDGGLDARDFFATGALNLYFLYWPLIVLFPLALTFNLIVSLVLFVVPSVSIFFAARLFGCSSRAASISGLLALAPTLQWFKWGLKFGTLGFLTTSGLFSAMCGLYYLVLAKEHQLAKRQYFFLIAISTLVFMWPLGCVISIPLGVLLFLRYKTVASKRYIIPTLLILSVINAPWAVIFAKVSKVNSFISGKNSTHSAVNYIAQKDDLKLTSLGRINDALHDNLIGFSPVILAMAIPGFTLLGGLQRLVLGSTIGWLALLAIFVSPFKPQLELTRFFIPIALLAAIPTGACIDWLLSRQLTMRWQRVALAAVVGTVLLTPFAATNAIRSRTMEKFQFSDNTLNKVSNFIKEHGGTGRTIFSGFVLHEFDGGHAAPLTLLTNKPIVASSFAHNQWSYKQVFPDSFLKDKDEGIDKYLTLMNATLVMAHEERWIKYFSEHKSRFLKVGEVAPFVGFQRLGVTPSYILSGSAELGFDENSIQVTPQTSEVTIKFRYFPFLKSSGCLLQPETYNELTLIKLTECTPGSMVTISSINALQRVLQ